jgi:hypothetical protein
VQYIAILDIYTKSAAIGNASAVALPGGLRSINDVCPAPTIDHIKSVIGPPAVAPGEPSYPVLTQFGDALPYDIEKDWTVSTTADASEQMKQICINYPDVELIVFFSRHMASCASAMEDNGKTVWPVDGCCKGSQSWLKHRGKSHSSAYSHPEFTDNSNDRAAEAEALANGTVDKEGCCEGIYLPLVNFTRDGTQPNVEVLALDTPTNVFVDKSATKANLRLVNLRAYNRATIQTMVLIHHANKLPATEETLKDDILREVAELVLEHGDERGGYGHVINSSKFFIPDFQTFSPDVRAHLWNEAMKFATAHTTADDLLTDLALRVQYSSMFQWEMDARVANICKKFSDLSDSRKDELRSLVDALPGNSEMRAACIKSLRVPQYKPFLGHT